MSQDFNDEQSDFEQSFSPAPPQQQKSGCLGISWLVVIPAGCFVSFLLCGGCVVGLVGVGLQSLKSSPPYAESVAAAQQNPDVVDALGEPIEPGFWLQGYITINNDDGEADFQIPISGPKGDGTIHVVAEMENGKWDYSVMEVDISGQRIPLLDEPADDGGEQNEGGK